MPRIQVIQDITNEKKPDEFMRQSSQIHQQTVDIMNGNLEFDKNIKSQTVSVDFTAVDTDVAVSHNLGKKEVNYLKGKQSVAMSVYDGSKPTTTTTIYLRSDTIGTATLVLY